MTNLEIFNFYHSLGYQPIPLFYKTKTPIYKNWNSNYNYESILEYVAQQKQLNFGILLGNIIDIEGDCADSNKIIDDLLHDVKHPCFMSAKSKHHLFRSNIKSLTRIVVDNVEFRGHKHQSVVPPSKHEDGYEYKWLTEIFNISSIPYLPQTIESYIISKLKPDAQDKKKKLLKPNHTSIKCNECKKSILISRIRLNKELHFLQKEKTAWACNKCRTFDLRKIIKCHKFQ